MATPPAPQNHPTLINVLGPGRSGTTMLDLMLGTGPEAFSCGEVYAWFRPWRTHHFKIVCSCGQTPCPAWSKIADIPEARFHRGVIDQIGVTHVIDSSKELNWVIDTQDWAVAAGMAVHNLLLWKDPKEMVRSHWSRDRDLLSWVESYIAYYDAVFRVGLPVRSVSLEALTTDPETQLRRICDLTGLPWHDDKPRFWTDTHHHLFGSMGTRKQMEAGHGKVHKDLPLDPKFEAAYAQVSAELTGNDRLNSTLARLKQLDVSQGTEPQGTFQRPLVMPRWYHIGRVRQFVRRRFPQPWHLEQ